MKLLSIVLLSLLAMMAVGQAEPVVYANDTMSVDLFLVDSVGNPCEFDTTAQDWGYIDVHWGGATTTTVFTDSFMIKNQSLDVKVEAATSGGLQKVIYRQKGSVLAGSLSVGRILSWKIMLRDSSKHIWTPISGQFNYIPRTGFYAGWADSVQNFVNVSSVSTSAIEPTDFSAAPDVNITKVAGTTVSVNVAGMLKVDLTYSRGSLVDPPVSGRLPSVGVTEMNFVKAAVDNGTGTDSSFVSTGLTQASNFWNLSRLIVFSGTRAPQVVIVKRSTLNSGKDSIIFKSKLSGALANGDSIALCPTGAYNVWATAFADSSILDTAFIRKFYESDTGTYNNVANSFGKAFADPNYMGGGSGSSNWTNAQRDSVLNGFADVGKMKSRLDSLANALADTHVQAKISWTWIGAAVWHYLVDTMPGAEFGTAGVRMRLTGDSTLYIKLAQIGISIDTVNDNSASTTQFIGKQAWGADNFPRDKALTFTSGVLALQTRRVTGYVSATKTYTIDAATSAPANGVTFILVPIGSSQSVVSVTLAAGQLSQISDSVAKRLLLSPNNKLYTDVNGYVSLGVTFPTNFNLFSIDAQGRVDISKQRGVTLPFWTYNAGTGDTLPPVNAAQISNNKQAADYLEDVFNGVTRVISASITGSVGSVTGGVGGGVGGNLSGNVLGNVNGSVGTVSNPVTVGTNNDKSGYLLSSAALHAIWAVDTAGLITSPNMAWLVYQAAVNAGGGGPGGTCLLDPDSIRKWVWDALQVDHVIPGTFGAYLNAMISSIAGLAGNGAYGYDCIVLDTSGTPDTVLIGSNAGKVYINNLQQNSRPWQADISPQGIAHFQLDAGTYVKFITTPGYVNILDTFTINATIVDTLKVTKGDVGRVTLAINAGSASGLRYANAKIIIELVSVNDSMLWADDTVVASNGKGFIEAYANSMGQASVPLYPNSIFDNDSTYYRFRAYDNKKGKIIDQFRFRIPTTAGLVMLKNIPRWPDMN